MGIAKWIFAGVGVAAIGGIAAYAQYRDTEEPAYKTVIADKPFELRDYVPMIVAEVAHSGDRRRASGQSFRRLAAYIFAQDRPEGGERIAMTAPVMQSRVDQDQQIAMTAPVFEEPTENGEWRMRFVMPSRFTMATLPTPPDDITLVEVPSRRMAAVRFSGNASAADLAMMQARLGAWLEEQQLTPVGDYEYAFYDAPMVPGPVRRNEVLVEVAAE